MMGCLCGTDVGLVVYHSGTSSLNAKHTTAFWWPLYSLFTSPVSTVHNLDVLSDDAAKYTTNNKPLML